MTFYRFLQTSIKYFFLRLKKKHCHTNLEMLPSVSLGMTPCHQWEGWRTPWWTFHSCNVPATSRHQEAAWRDWTHPWRWPPVTQQWETSWCAASGGTEPPPLMGSCPRLTAVSSHHWLCCWPPPWGWPREGHQCTLSHPRSLASSFDALQRHHHSWLASGWWQYQLSSQIKFILVLHYI